MYDAPFFSEVASPIRRGAACYRIWPRCSARAGRIRTCPRHFQFAAGSLVAEALDRNPELRFYQAEIAAAKAGRRTAGLWANPEINGAAGQKSVRAGGLNDEGVAWSVSIAQPFEWPGRLGLRKAIANRDVDLAELGYERFRAALASRVRMLGYTLFAAQERAAAAREVADRFRALREVLVQRDPAGITPLLELRVVEATELTAQRSAAQSTLSEQSALLELNQLRGVSPNTRLSVDQPNLAFRSPEPVQTLLSLAQTNNFELRLRSVELAQQGFRVALAKNERFPTLAIRTDFFQRKKQPVSASKLSVPASHYPLPLWNLETKEIFKRQRQGSFRPKQYFCPWLGEK